MSASLDQPAPQYVQPGPDQRMPSLDEAVDLILMWAQKDGPTSPEFQRPLQRMMSGLQMVGEQKAAEAAGQAPQGPGDGTEDFGAQEGTEPAGGTDQLPPGVQNAGSGY